MLCGDPPSTPLKDKRLALCRAPCFTFSPRPQETEITSVVSRCCDGVWRRHKNMKKIGIAPFQSRCRLVHTARTVGVCPGCLLWNPGQARSAPWSQGRCHRPSQDHIPGRVEHRFIAGWSSPVARQAHNLKVIGSNPIPATISNCETPALVAGVFVLRETARIPARSPRTSIFTSPPTGVRVSKEVHQFADLLDRELEVSAPHLMKVRRHKSASR